MPASYDLSGSVALVTGAAGDIGRTVAVRIAESGASVALTDLDRAAEGLERTRADCAAAGGEGRVLVAPADVTDAAAVAGVFETTSDRFGTPDLVFNNAGVQGELLPLQDYPTADFAFVMDVNVNGIFNVLLAAAQRMRQAGVAGAIVNSASMAGVEGAANMPAYSASKGAVMSLTRSASKDLAPLGIRVNAISPAFIGEGLMWDRQVLRQARANTQYYSTDPAVVAEEMIGAVPLRRTGTLAEVAATVIWLLSDESSYVNGQNVIISGGI
jgi:NAD(P)-dependent dehydrogenase (short-subunit alcohol dehydrogenase family)